MLHLDAAHEADAPVVFAGMDGMSKIVLAGAKMPSESSEHIAPFLRALRENYGDPAVCVHDMGKGICKALPDELPGVPDSICHWHFLADIGSDLLGDSYGSLRKSLRKHSASKRLGSLAREAKKELVADSAESRRLASAIGDAASPDGPELVEPALIYSLSLWILQGKQSGGRPWISIRPSPAQVFRKNPSGEGALAGNQDSGKRGELRRQVHEKIRRYPFRTRQARPAF